jgi:hypothetical protein
MERQLITGQHIIFFDEYRTAHPALVTAWWSQTCCNLVYVSGDEKKDDSYGRQIERSTSVSHKSAQGDVIFGNCWCWSDEV